VLNYLWRQWPAWIIVGEPVFAMVVRLLRLSILGTLSDQYIGTGRGKGLAERPTLSKHALRNALNPLVSMVGVRNTAASCEALKSRSQRSNRSWCSRYNFM